MSNVGGESVACIDAGIITNCQTFINDAAIRQLTITKKSGFIWSLATEQEDVVAMISSMKRRDDTEKPTPNKELKTVDKHGEASYGKKELYLYSHLPFVKETKNSIILWK